MKNKIIDNVELGLPELWLSLSAMGIAQLIAAVIIIFGVFLFILTSLLIVTGKWEKVVQVINKKQANAFASYKWPTMEIIDIHNLGEKLSYMENDATTYKKMLLHKISHLRQENVSGKQFIIDMSKTTYMSSAIRKVFYEIAEDSYKLNIVRLVYVVPKIKRTKNLTDTEKFFIDITNLCREINKPTSFTIKEGINIKIFS